MARQLNMRISILSVRGVENQGFRNKICSDRGAVSLVRHKFPESLDTVMGSLSIQ